MLYTYKDDLRRFNFNILTERYIYDWAGTAFIIAMIGQGVCNGIYYFLSNHQPQNLSMQLFSVPMVSVASVLVAPIVEETVFRKIIFGYLNKTFNFYVGAIISSLLFAAAHLNLWLVPGYFLVGMVFCWVYKKSGSLLPSLISHTYMNFIVLIVTSLKTNIHM
jgi:membrane protease YdiL (CAAX protease family)